MGKPRKARSLRQKLCWRLCLAIGALLNEHQINR